MGLKEEMHDHLVNDILPYWMKKTVDVEQGGFFGRIDGTETLHVKADKGCVLNARILWTFSAAYNHFQDTEYLEIAGRAFNYLINHFIDEEYGGVFWMVDYFGNHSETKKQIYAQAFAIYGLSEYYKASKNIRALDVAKELFNVIEKHAFDRKENGYFEAYDRHWSLLEDLRLSDKDANEKKTMNTHLHVLEAYTALYEIWKDKFLEKQLKNLVKLFLDKFINKENHRFMLFFDEYWLSKSDDISFGHDIEGSWLLQKAAEKLDSWLLIRRTKKLAVAMVNAVMENGMDADGGIMYEAEPDGIRDTDKHWWPQAEGIVGFVNAWQNTGDEKYLQRAEAIWQYIKKYIIDTTHGEWWYRVTKDGLPYVVEDKVGPWKGPYHNGRACLEIIKRL